MPHVMNRPTVRQTVEAVQLVAEATGAREATYCFERHFAVALDMGWSLVLSADDAERFRLDACLCGRVRATMWCLAGNRRRLTELAMAAGQEAALVAGRRG